MKKRYIVALIVAALIVGLLLTAENAAVFMHGNALAERTAEVIADAKEAPKDTSYYGDLPDLSTLEHAKPDKQTKPKPSPSPSPTPEPSPSPEPEPEPVLTYLGTFYITGYNPMDGSQCGKSQDSPYLGIGAAGVKIIPGEHVAMCSAYPFGTQIYIEGLGYYVVQDRGVGPGCVDVACETNAACYAITGHYEVYLVGHVES